MGKSKKSNRRTFLEIMNSFVKMQTNLFFVSFSFEQIDETTHILNCEKKIETANIF